MFGKRIRLFRLFGFDVHVDWSWTILAFLVAWSLSAGFFPAYYDHLSVQTYWAMGIAGTIGLFFSIVFHEMTHSLVARRYGMPMKGITLFIFGGVAEMGEEPPSPRAEFWMAVAGPLSSVFLSGMLYGGYRLAAWNALPVAVTGVASYLSYINLLLAGFNTIPAFPLDGGRMLRSLLWGWKKDLRWATAIASKIGSGFGIFLILLGVFTFIQGNIIGGMWWFLIGMFLRNAVSMSYQQVLIREALEGETVRRFMKSDAVTVPPSLTIAELVEEYVYVHHFKMFPVVEQGERLVGCVTTRQIKEVPRERWKTTQVREIMLDCAVGSTIVNPDLDAVAALSLMRKSGLSRLMVAEGDRLRGVVSLKDLLEFLALKMELEER